MTGVWSDDSDVTQLAQRLRVGPHELLEALGGPWHVALRADGEEMARPGTLFVGRAGPSVAVVVDDEPIPLVTVGVAVGEWIDPGTIAWSTRPIVGRFRTPEVDAPAAEVDRFVEELGSAVDEAAAAKAPRLVVCRYCGALVAPEHALREECCHGCGSTVFGIVY
jgi:hypothetical protein